MNLDVALFAGFLNRLHFSVLYPFTRFGTQLLTSQGELGSESLTSEKK